MHRGHASATLTASASADVGGPLRDAPGSGDTARVSRRAVVAGGAALGVAASALARPRPAHAITILERLIPGGGAEGSAKADVSASGDTGAAVAPTAERPQFLSTLGDGGEGEVQEPSCADNPWASDLSNVANVGGYYFTDAQLAALAQNGFFQALGGGGYEFFELYETNRYSFMPNFVTVDSMVHTYHLYFAYLLRGCERSSLSGGLLDLSRRMLAGSVAQLSLLSGTEWEQAAGVVASFFAVGTELLDPAAPELAQVPEALRPAVDAELGLVGACAGIADSPLFGDQEDYSQYAPRGYYAGDPALEAYFRAMMWYGRRNFKQSDEGLDRCALLITLGLAAEGDGSAAEPCASEWEGIYQVTSFFAGASDDLGYYEYLPLARQAYGEGVTVADLPGDADGWQTFHDLTGQARAPQINSVPVMDEGQGVDHAAQNKGFRFMGQRFTVDATIFQQLIYSAVGERPDGARRMLPDVLDVPAALGSSTAHAVLEAQGDTTYPGYEENLAELRDAIGAEPQEFWRASLYAQWLHMLRPLLEEKGQGWPNAMRGDAWARRDLQTFAGSYAELKHDTVLYGKQVMAEAGGAFFENGDDRGYVEPEPAVFGRLAALVRATSEGLSSFGLLADADAQNLSILEQLATQLQTIANKELRDELPTDDEFELIRSFGVQLEHFWQVVHQEDADSEAFTTIEFPAALVTDIATDPNGSVLEIGTGQIATLYVIVPVDGTLRVASGPGYSFYQFEQPIDSRLTDADWWEELGIQPSQTGAYDYDAVREANAGVVPWVSDFTWSWWDA